MKITLVYTFVPFPMAGSSGDRSAFEEAARRFAKTITVYPPGVDCDLVVLTCSKNTDPGSELIFARIPLEKRYAHYAGEAKDCGAWQWAARNLEADLIVGLNAHTHFHRRNWLQPLMAAFWTWGPGLYGPSASYEIAPHLRTPCLAFPPSIMCKYPYELTKPQDANAAECGAWSECGAISFTNWFGEVMNLPTLCVLWETAIAKLAWRDPQYQNIYRRGDQSNQLVWDRSHTAYAWSPPDEQARLTKAADGG